MTGSAMAATIDYLVDKFTNGITATLPTGVALNFPGLTTIDPNVEVADFIQQTSGSPWVTVGISGENQDTDVSNTNQYLVLGRQRIDEAFSIPCSVLQYGDENQFSTTRLAAIALYDRCVDIVWADPTLGGILKYGKIATISAATLTQFIPAKGAGSAVSIEFSVTAENAYVPNEGA